MPPISRLAVGCLAFPLFLTGCSVTPVPAKLASAAPPSAAVDWAVRAARLATPQFATGFTVRPLGGAVELILRRPWAGADKPYLVYLVKERADAPAEARPDQILQIPARRVAALSASYLPWFTRLDALDHVAMVGAPSNIVNKTVRARLAEGKIAAVGAGAEMSRERLAAARADAILFFALAPDDFRPFAPLAAAGATLLPIAEYLEEAPLGRAEWLLVAGLLVDKSEQARACFADTQARYESLRARAECHARQAGRRPTVLLNAPFQGVWWLPGGANHMATMIHDAGGDYVGKDLPGANTREIDFESVLALGADADWWLNPGAWRDRSAGRAQDERHTRFRAWRESRVANFDKRGNGAGATDFFETGVSQPDEILADLLHLFYPGESPNHELKYYRLLQ